MKVASQAPGTRGEIRENPLGGVSRPLLNITSKIYANFERRLGVREWCLPDKVFSNLTKCSDTCTKCAVYFYEKIFDKFYFHDLGDWEIRNEMKSG